METAITFDIKVSVESMYQPIYSKPLARKFIHAYQITIENLGESSVQLLDRHWIIWDALGLFREVKGAGVVGKQPILHAGEMHRYQSSCQMASEFGKMFGSYGMIRVEDRQPFDIKIPTFELLVPYKFN